MVMYTHTHTHKYSTHILCEYIAFFFYLHYTVFGWHHEYSAKCKWTHQMLMQSIIQKFTDIVCCCCCCVFFSLLKHWTQIFFFFIAVVVVVVRHCNFLFAKRFWSFKPRMVVLFCCFIFLVCVSFASNNFRRIFFFCRI